MKTLLFFFVAGTICRAQSIESEPNNTIAQANAISLGASASGQLSSATDVDTFFLNAPAGVTQLGFAFSPANSSFVVSVLNSAGVALSTFTPAAFTSIAPVNIGGGGGLYYIQVRSAFVYSPLQYTFSASNASVLAAGRLINLSILTEIAPNGSITAGFVVGANPGPRNLVIRAVGPALAQFGVTGVMADPRLTIFNASRVAIAANDNWDSNTQAASAMASVGAFALPFFSRDAALVGSLTPGNYTAVVTGVNGVGGTVLLEVYELP